MLSSMLTKRRIQEYNFIINVFYVHNSAQVSPFVLGNGYGAIYGIESPFIYVQL